LLLVGASVTFGYCVDGQGWAQLFARRAEARGWRVTNAAVCGASSADWLRQLPALLRREPWDAVLLATSLTNDDVLDAPRPAADDYEAGTRRLLAMVAAERPAARIVLGGVNPVGAPGSTLPAGVYDALTRVTATLQAVADTDPRVVGLCEHMRTVDDGTGCWRAGLALDDIHPNVAGHRAMFDACGADALLTRLEAAE
jgi:lysophospholipase L1-like esterase